MYKKYLSRSPFSPFTSVHTIVSFLFPKEHRDFFSFLVLCDVSEESGDNEDDDVVNEDVEEEQDEGDVVVGLEVVLLHGELGADWEAGCGQFSSASSMCTMAA